MPSDLNPFMYNEEPIAMNINLGNVLVCNYKFANNIQCDLNINPILTAYNFKSECMINMFEITNNIDNQIKNGKILQDLEKSQYYTNQNLLFWELNPNKTVSFGSIIFLKANFIYILTLFNLLLQDMQKCS